MARWLWPKCDSIYCGIFNFLERVKKKQCQIWFYNSDDAQMHLQNRIVFSDLVHVASCREGSFGNIKLSAGTNHFAHLQPRNFESCRLCTAYTWLQLVFQAYIGWKGKAIWMNEIVNGWWVDLWRDEWMEWGKVGYYIRKQKLNPTWFLFLWAH
jgi:hypothetical protein